MKVEITASPETLDLFPERCPLAPESGPELKIRQLIYVAFANDAVFALQMSA